MAMKLKFQLLVVSGILIASLNNIKALKFPIAYARNSAPNQGDIWQLKVEGNDQLTEIESKTATDRMILFPEKTEETESSESPVQFSFLNEDTLPRTEISGLGLERFYKYSAKPANTQKNQPRADEMIVFPQDNIESIKNRNVHENRRDRTRADDLWVDSRTVSKLNGYDNSETGIYLDESQKNTNRTKNFMQSLEILAQMVRQLLFRVPVTDTTPSNNNTETEIPTFDTTPTPEQDVQEQSLYAGPKLRTSSSSAECPEGLKRTRNGGCQKPSRRLANS